MKFARISYFQLGLSVAWHKHAWHRRRRRLIPGAKLRIGIRYWSIAVSQKAFVSSGAAPDWPSWFSIPYLLLTQSGKRLRAGHRKLFIPLRISYRLGGEPPGCDRGAGGCSKPMILWSQRPCLAHVCVILTSVCYLCIVGCMVRTTLILEESSLEGIRDLARKQGKTLSQVTNELLAEGLQRRKVKRRPDFKLPAFSMGKPRLNLGDRNALEALMDS